MQKEEQGKNGRRVDFMIFDLDGTLVDSGADIVATVNHTRRSLGLPAQDMATILPLIGDGIKDLIARAIGKANESQHQEAIAIYTKHYTEHLLDNTVTYEGIEDMLHHFGDKQKILITNKRIDFANAVIDRLNLRQYFVEVIGGDSFGYMKPDIRLLFYCAEKYCVKPMDMVVIGDGVNDVVLAKKTMAISCAHLNGLTDRQILLDLSPDYSYENAEELCHIFR
ncbi:MAG: HAD-IA family hydrolase [Deltaproteobacteria bacterium]